MNEFLRSAMATFILVHGTRAKSAHWPFLQDSLAETARAAGEEALFEQLMWTGRNRASARQDAASAIFTSVQAIQRTSANKKIFLIGHSHGGSAIAYFLKEHPEAAKTLAGCAFLSTPFVAIRPRKQAIRLMLVLIWFPVLAFLSLWAEWNPMYFSALFLVSVSATVLFVHWAGDPQQLLKLSIRQQTANIPAGNYLFVRCSGDEAAAALSAGQFIAWLGIKASKIPEVLSRLFFPRPFFPDRAATVPSMVIRGFVRGFASISAVTVIGYGWYVLGDIAKLGVLGHFFSPDGPFIGKLDFVHMPAIVFDFLSFVLVSLLLLCLSAVILIFFTQALSSWAFGWTRLTTGFLVELAIEPLPFGEHSLVHIDWAASSTGLDGMVHSWTYAHPVALMHLQNWVRASLGKMTAVETTTVAPTDQRTH
jgi:pimeloyl-ACP methyl ester carboxylesterase